MGLLDDLKKQAEQLKTQQLSQQVLREDSVKLVEDKMKLSFQYLNDLLKQLVVLKPVNPTVFAIPGVGELKDLPFVESFIDYRKTRLDNVELFDLISFYIRWGSTARIVVDRDMPTTAQKVRDALYLGGIKFAEEEIKNERRVTAAWRFTAESAIVTDVKIQAEREKMRVSISAKNLIRLGIDDFAVPAADIDEPWLEDFAVTLLGQPGNLRKYRTLKSM